jgi:signal peptidase II
MNVRSKTLNAALIITLVLIIDRLVKSWALRTLPPLGSLGTEPVPGLLRFVYVENRGVAFGLFQNNSLLFAILSTLIIIGIVWRAWRWFLHADSMARTSAALIVAGGVGNIIDRVLYGFVVDMVNIIPLPIFQVFNVADLSISLGAVLLFISLWREDVRQRAAIKRQPVDDAGVQQ